MTIDFPDKIFDKILECVDKGQITDRKDLKLFGIEEPGLQKEVMWKLFEEKITATSSKKEKHKLKKPSESVQKHLKGMKSSYEKSSKAKKAN